MAGVFESVGFATGTEEELRAMVRRTVEEGERTDLGGGLAQRSLSDASGAGVVLVTDGEGEDLTVRCASASFTAPPGAALRVGAWVEDAECPWCATLTVDVLADGQRAYGAVAEIPDVATVRPAMREGDVRDASLVLFAPGVLPNGGRLPVRAASASEPGEPFVVSGVVLAAERRTNGIGGRDFGHVRLSGPGAEYDVVLSDATGLAAPGDEVIAGGRLLARVVT